jgi:hypothetical protein
MPTIKVSPRLLNNTLELGMKEGKDEKYIGTIFSKQQTGFDYKDTKK